MFEITKNCTLVKNSTDGVSRFFHLCERYLKKVSIEGRWCLTLLTLICLLCLVNEPMES